MTLEKLIVSAETNQWLRTVRPHGVYKLHGMAFIGDRLITIDSIRGYLLEIDCTNDNTKVLNPEQAEEFIDSTGLGIWDKSLWLTRDNSVYFCENVTDTLGSKRLNPQHFVTLAYPANSVAVWQSTVYVSCQRTGLIFVFNRYNGQQITQFYAPGIGVENITVREEELWVCDSTEQTVYCMDRATGEIKFSVLTPFANPTGLAFHRDPTTGKDILYVVYSNEEPYIRDDPNSSDPYQLTFRDRVLIHPLDFYYNPDQGFALSNGYLVEMSYVEELACLDEVHLENLEWRIALPAETDRQHLRSVEAIGMPFTEEIEEGQRIALFKFDHLKGHQSGIFGWKALIEVRGIKYQLKPLDVENLPPLPPEFQERYLVDNDHLAMDTEIVRQAAQEAIGTETNLLRKILSIRDYVYDKLSYGIQPKIDPPDQVLQRGVGSCGEYVGVLLALLRLNGIACRTVGRYKCPPHPDRQNIPLHPDYNHVWLEFYIPGVGWVPMESNPDDLIERGTYPLRFFMGLAWYHVELGKGIRFESLNLDGVRVHKRQIPIGELALNHIQFKILGELPAMP
ncbi:transglutaminase-like domain-containing protein [Planktothricoides raciborskii]|uniref:Transglutaminase domain-containing protein n=2 Tax=Planktothricoides raciborskii TaxID=132608 RepID=A0AAU8JBQ9_9CYAN|nr:transglutaminase family protein [Planktothricoides raciborskii]MBD2547345.1 transglutaminase [Planktothricoides raciborskii FACHB-1370]MBD2585845.1 transglutaminase [Planktothricoides raciborskii FACHB-1261]